MAGRKSNGGGREPDGRGPAGGAARVIQQKLVDERAISCGMDAGVLFGLLKQNIFFGATVRPVDLARLLGLCFMLLGVWLVVR